MGKVIIPIRKMIKHTKMKGETLRLRLPFFQTKKYHSFLEFSRQQNSYLYQKRKKNLASNLSKTNSILYSFKLKHYETNSNSFLFILFLMYIVYILIYLIY
jgi:hypothetical protein